jgi:response regulator NasT
MKNKQLLLVDDDELVLATFARGLRDIGYETSLATSGEEALTLVKNSLPDLILLDISMPGLSGIETAKALKNFDIPVVFLSAYDDRDTVKSAVEIGALGYLIKPINVAHAVPTIEAALQRAHEIKNLEINTQRLSSAIDTSNQVNIVLGILMERHNINQQAAFEKLRTKARNDRRKVRVVAAEILEAWNIIVDL